MLIFRIYSYTITQKNRPKHNVSKTSDATPLASSPRDNSNKITKLMRLRVLTVVVVWDLSTFCEIKVSYSKMLHVWNIHLDLPINSWKVQVNIAYRLKKMICVHRWLEFTEFKFA